jgi:hypothetical protein
LLRTFDEIVHARVQQSTGLLQQQVADLQSQLAQTNRFLAALFISFTEKFEFSAESSNEEIDNLLFSACADEANEMTRLILSRTAERASGDDIHSQPTLRPIVARELTTERKP